MSDEAGDGEQPTITVRSALAMVVVFVALLGLFGGCFAMLGGSRGHSVDVVANCEAAIRAKAAPAIIEFHAGGSPVVTRDGNGFDVGGKATVGTKRSFTYYCSTDAQGNVTGTDSDQPT